MTPSLNPKIFDQSRQMARDSGLRGREVEIQGWFESEGFWISDQEGDLSVAMVDTGDLEVMGVGRVVSDPELHHR